MSPRFEQDRQAFMLDLMRTGNIGAARAESLAAIAVREAYERRVPPALVFGVMMVENPQLKSTARSKVGALGLMQIYPRAWVPTLRRKFGADLRDDETNLRYGVFILSHLLDRGSDWIPPDSAVRVGLLRYNGCVRGTNTPDCHRYPDLVRRRIETLALAQCGDAGYEACVEHPLRLTRKDAAATW
jgi:soluble lytic murein transglycosylase-like protein